MSAWGGKAEHGKCRRCEGTGYVPSPVHGERMVTTCPTCVRAGRMPKSPQGAERAG